MRSSLLLGALGALAALAAVPGRAGAQWSDLGLSGREVTQLRSSHGLLYAGTNDGLYRKASDTADSSWALLGFAGQRVHDVLAVSPETLIVARQITGGGADTVAMLRSTDGGTNWSPFQNGFAAPTGDPHVVRLLAPAGSPGTILAASNVICKSTDGGLTWRRVGYAGISCRFLVEGPAAIWAGGTTAVFTPFVARSSNGGESWTVPFVFQSEADPLAMAFDPSDANAAFLSLTYGLYRTANNGTSWTVFPGPYFWGSVALENRALAPLRLYVNGLSGSQGATFLAPLTIP